MHTVHTETQLDAYNVTQIKRYAHTAQWQSVLFNHIHRFRTLYTVAATLFARSTTKN